jgi:non-ribosomal peptide synthetase component F
MNMLRNSRASLRDGLSAVGDLSARSVFGAEASLAWSDLAAGTVLAGRASELRGRSVVIATTHQLTAIATLVELDGAARRIVLYPPDMSLEYLPYVVQSAAADAIVCDRPTTGLEIPGVAFLSPSSWTRMPRSRAPEVEHETEWVLLTSGTTGRPKLVVHTLASLAGAIDGGQPAADRVVWSTFYDIRRYGGLQILLRAALTGTSLVLSSAEEATADFLARAGAHGVTHISGTPSHWRRASMTRQS